MFKELDPITLVPVKGAWVSCIAVCLLTSLLDIEELTFLISVENLLTYSLVNAGVLAMRFRKDSDVRDWNERYVWAFMLSSFLFSLSWGYGWHIYVIIILGLVTLGLIIKMHFIP